MAVSTFMTRVVLVLAVFDRSADLGPKFVASSGQQLDVVFFMDETFWILGWDKRHMIAWFHRNAFGFDIGLGQSQTRVGMVRCYLPKIDHLNRTGMSANEMIRKLVNDIENHDHWQWDSKLDRCYGVVADMFQEQYGDRITAPNIAIGLVYPEYTTDVLDGMKKSFTRLKERASLIIMVALGKISSQAGQWFHNWEDNYNQPMKDWMARMYNDEKYYIVRSSEKEIPPVVLQMINEAFPKYVQNCVMGKNKSSCQLENNVCQRTVDTFIEYAPDPEGTPCPTVSSAVETCEDLLCCENHNWTVKVECGDPCDSNAVEKLERPKTDNLEVERTCPLEKDMNCSSEVQCEERKNERNKKEDSKKVQPSSDNTVTIVAAVIGSFVFVIICIVIIVIFVRSRKRKKKPIKQWQSMESMESRQVSMNVSLRRSGVSKRTAKEKKPNKKSNPKESSQSAKQNKPSAKQSKKSNPTVSSPSAKQKTPNKKPNPNDSSKSGTSRGKSNTTDRMKSKKM